jgi:glutaredoxin 3
MLQRAPSARTLPQIFIGDTHVGGSDDLAALDNAGTLDRMLAQE